MRSEVCVGALTWYSASPHTVSAVHASPCSQYPSRHASQYASFPPIVATHVRCSSAQSSASQCTNASSDESPAQAARNASKNKKILEKNTLSLHRGDLAHAKTLTCASVRKFFVQ